METHSKRVLIAEDETKAAELLKRIFGQIGWQADSAPDGSAALQRLKEQPYEVLLTDLNMPGMNGMELVSRVNWELAKPPLMIMFTAYVDEGIRQRAKQHGVYEVLQKPSEIKKLASCFFQGLRELKNGTFTPPKTKAPGPVNGAPAPLLEVVPAFPVVVVAISTGGPSALKNLFGPWVKQLEAPVVVVQHGPDWAIRSLVESLSRDLEEPDLFRLAEPWETPEPNRVYFAYGDRHLILEPETGRFRSDEGPPVNFLRPAADPLFFSAAEGFGPYALGVVMTGLGRDGARGARKIRQAGGQVLIQSPESATLPFMPQAVRKELPDVPCSPLDQLPARISQEVKNLREALQTVQGGPP